LAKSANIKPQTATSHLNKMLDGNLIIKDIYGKYHYYKLASKEIANFLETMLCLCEEDEITSLKQSMQSQELKNARLCYDHVAGKLGILIRNRLLQKRYIVKRENKFILTSRGITFLKNIDITSFKNLSHDKIKEDFEGYECL
ncbi:MAG: helix-turn-helix domain-containing protein, partial [Clostridium perfringens]|nr:helix-turn-helix domain-containing protein [Clostridium perfringens]